VSSGQVSIQRVSEPEQVKLLLHARVCRVLGGFLAAEQTVSGAARALSLDLRIVHRDVQALVKAGLLRVTRREARSGRAVAHYQASAGAYFVPQSLHPDADGAEQFQREFAPIEAVLNAAVGREFERAINEDGNREWGTRIFIGEEGLDIDQCYFDAELRGILTGWQGPASHAFTGVGIALLTDAEASEIQGQFVRLVTRLKELGDANKAQGKGRRWAVRTLLTPLGEDDLVGVQTL
jgi:predicted transcriptional regulator